MIEVISYTLIHGFSLYSLVLFITRLFFSRITKEKAERLDLSACQIAALSGSVYLILFIINILSMERYALPIWIGPLCILCLQVLWFEKLRKLIWLRLLLGCLLLFSPEDWVIFLTSINRDYLPSTWSIPIYNQIRFLLTDTIIFITAVTSFHGIKWYFNRK